RSRLRRDGTIRGNGVHPVRLREIHGRASAVFRTRARLLPLLARVIPGLLDLWPLSHGRRVLDPHPAGALHRALARLSVSRRGRGRAEAAAIAAGRERGLAYAGAAEGEHPGRLYLRGGRGDRGRHPAESKQPGHERRLRTDPFAVRSWWC